jgi:succinoglycan biosynthesis protein ExoO
MNINQRILTLISKQRITGANNGSSAYVLSLARFAKELGYSVQLIVPSPTIFGRTPFMRLGDALDCFDKISIRGAITIGRWRIALAPYVWLGAVHGTLTRLLNKVLKLNLVERKAPYSIASNWTENDKQYAVRHCHSNTTHILFDYAFQTAVLPNVAKPERKTATIMHDLFHARSSLFKSGDVQDSVALLTMEDEVQMLAKADTVIAIQASEAAFVTDNCPDTEVIIVPMPSEIAPQPQPGENGSILFVGSSTTPNVNGVRWFLDKVWPSVLENEPTAHFHVAGSVANAFIGQKFAGVTFLGLVEDLAQLYENSGIVISPLFQGSGLKIKLVEALGKGKMMVATSVSVQGVEELSNQALIVTDNASDFTRAICDNINSVSSRMAWGKRALESAQQNFSEEVVFAEYRKWLETQPGG